MTVYQFNRDHLEAIHIDRENYYSLLLDRKRHVLVLEVVITWVAWYSVYFWLSSEEYTLFRNDKASFDRVVGSYASDKGERFYTTRLLMSEAPGADRLRGEDPVPIETLE